MILPKSKMREALVRAMHWRKAAANARARRSAGKIERILVVRPDHLGDLLFATAALDRLRAAFPRAHITGAVGPWGRAMWAGNPNLNAIEVIPFPGIAQRAGGGPLAPYNLLGKAITRIARERFDLGIVLRFDHWWGAALLWGAGIPMRWGYNIPGTDVWLTNAVPYTPGRHEVEQDLHLVQSAVGLNAKQNRQLAVGLNSTLDPQPLTIDRARGLPPLRPPQSEALSGDLAAGWQEAPRRVIIHPGTAAANKLWTITGWAAIVEQLASGGWSVALTGSPGERPLAEAICVACRGGFQTRPYNLAGRTANLEQLTWTLGQAHMVLGVDSGPLHIADALHKPTLHLYGPSDERIWGPWGDPQRHRAFRAPGTRPGAPLDIASVELEGGPEMRAITQDMVIEELEILTSMGV